MDSDFEKNKESVRHELANYLGLEPADIEDESILSEDLHMKASDLTDFMEVLGRMGMETRAINLPEIETFSDMVDQLNEHQ